MAKEKKHTHVEDAYDPNKPYEGSAAVDIEEKPKGIKPEKESIQGGWNPYRGTEQHGVQQPAIPMEVDSWEKESQDELDARFFHKPKGRDAEPEYVVKGWTREPPPVRVTSRMNAITLQRQSWTKIVDINARRVLLSFWVGITPAGSDIIYFVSGKPNKPTAHCPRIQNGGQQAGIYQLLSTDEIFVYADTTTTDYIISVIEEYEVEN